MLVRPAPSRNRQQDNRTEYSRKILPTRSFSQNGQTGIALKMFQKYSSTWHVTEPRGMPPLLLLPPLPVLGTLKQKTKNTYIPTPRGRGSSFSS